jgi:hypothetical protein
LNSEKIATEHIPKIGIRYINQVKILISGKFEKENPNFKSNPDYQLIKLPKPQRVRLPALLKINLFSAV